MVVPSGIIRQITKHLQNVRNDVLLEAPNSTSRINSWLIPLLSLHKPRTTGLPSILVVSPTKDTAADVLTQLHVSRDSHSAVIGAIGGSLKEGNLLELLRGCDYLVGTPGRLSWLLKEGHADLKELHAIVLDEANVLLSSDMVVEIMKDFVPLRAQRVICTSTKLDDWYEDVMKDVVTRPGASLERITVHRAPPSFNPDKSTSPIHYYVRVNPNEELKQIRYMIDSHREECMNNGSPFKAVIVPRSSTDSLIFHSSLMFKGCIFVSSEMTATTRNQQMAKFNSSKNSVLVCSAPLMSELRCVSLIISCGVPRSIETYLSTVATCPERVMKSVVVIRHTDYDKFKRNILSRSGSTAGIHFGTIPLPSSDDLSIQFAESLVDAVKTNALSAPTPKLLSLSKELLELHGSKLLAGLLEMTETRRALLEKTSLLSGMSSYTPVLLFDPFMKKLKTHDHCQKLVKNCLRRVSKDASSNIGRIVLSEKGFVVDVPSLWVNDLVKSPSLRNIKAIVVSEMPKLVDNTKLFVLRQITRDRKLLTSRARIGRTRSR